MKFIEKITNRYFILRLIVIILVAVLTFRLATLTIVEGEEYRNISDNTRLREIYVPPRRGDIRDRYGRLLAGTKPSFTVQLMKDELQLLDREERNETLLILANLLEEDGATYIEDFPVDFNTFSYSNLNDYLVEETSPGEKVLKLIIDNNVLIDLLGKHYVYPSNDNHFKFATSIIAKNALEYKEIDVPIHIDINNGLYLEFDSEATDISMWKTRNDLGQDISPVEAIAELIGDDKSMIRKIISHPISRKLVYEILVEKEINDNIIINDYSLSFDDEYLNNKILLMKEYEDINFNSSAQSDFIQLFLKNHILYDEVDNTIIDLDLSEGSQEVEIKEKGDTFENLALKSLLEKVKVGEDDNIIPGEILIDLIESKGEVPIVSLEYNEENNLVIYRYRNTNINTDVLPIDALIKQALSLNIIEEFVIMDEVKGLAQEALLDRGINPRISIINWEYVFTNNKNNWKEKYKLDEDKSVEEMFNKMREYHSLDETLSPYEARGVMSLYQRLDKQGHRAYQPINITYGLSDKTVAKIEEGLMGIKGVEVSIEAVRYYPYKETAAHILGTLGKISQNYEIERYVNELKYSPNDIIGKTGIEESFEENLRGESGFRMVEVDAVGNTTNVIEDKAAIPGDNVYLTIDLKLQQLAEKALKETLEEIQVGGEFKSQWGNYSFGINRSKNRPYINATSGSLVALDIKTSEVLALVNYPAYDPNLFSTGISQSDWISLFPEDERDLLAPRPLYNIAMQTAVQPGSTFKMVTALAGLEKGLSPYKTIRDMGYVTIGDRTMGCWIWNQSRGSHGHENVLEALRDSCNYYFYSLALGYNQRTGDNIGVKVEIEDIVDISEKLGLNDKTGIEINIPNEASGGVPNPQSKAYLTKTLLRRFITANIRDYIEEDILLNQDEINERIDTIVSWVEEDLLSRNEVIRRLNSMDIKAETPLPGNRSGLADIIKYDYLNQAGWNIIDTLNVTIGQGQNSYTPLQMANYTSIIANGGYKNQVSVVDTIKNYDNTKIVYNKNIETERIDLNNYDNLEYLKQGMLKVSTEGTARSVFSSFPVDVGVKTGTAELKRTNPVTGDTYDHYGWFVAFAPYDDPQIAVAAMIFQGGSGGYAGPMAREVIAEYLGLNESEDGDSQLPTFVEFNR